MTFRFLSRINKAKKYSVRIVGLAYALTLGAVPVLAAGENSPAFKVNGKVTTVGELSKEDQAAFYDIEKKKYELIVSKAESAYLADFWNKMAKSKGKSVQEVRQEYFDKNAKVSEKEIARTLERFKDHPQLSKMPKKEQEKQVREYLKDRDTKELIQVILSSAHNKGELVLLYPEPKEPIYKLTIKDTDHVRYGPKDTDVQGLGCSGEKCPITIVEYSEFQCPFCSKVIPDTKRILTEYKGKVRWIVRDFPLSFHDRARPAAIAAKCASFQGKYWSMYNILFKNQRALGDADLRKYAGEIGLDLKKYDGCIQNPDQARELIDENFQSGAELGVSGTPAFFINGRRLSGALPFAQFKAVIDSELNNKG